MWERSLQDLIRGLRSHKTSGKAELDAFLEEAMTEIRGELRGKDMELKAEGVVKMCYLMMLYPLAPPPSFAFHVVEVMSSQRYHLKQLGYVAAPMAFSFDTEEIVLTVNGIRKDLLASQAHLPPLALMGLSDIVTPALARDVYADVATLTTHSRPHVRKRAVLALFRIFERYPEAMKMGFGRLRDRLEDDDPGVVSATVNVVTELSRKSNPKNFLPLAPQLFDLLTTSSNNWMLIKIVKLFATLTPIEPRLVRKLLPPITNLITTTPAISLLYECVRTCITGGMLEGQTEAGDALARVCVEKLSTFLSDEDQNLKYIALLAMVKIVPTHPHLIADYQDEILQSLNDEDVSIRMRALELVSSMVNRRNLKEIVTQLISHLVIKENSSAEVPSAASLLARTADGAAITSNASSQAVILSPAYRLELVHRIMEMTSTNTYENVSDFEWYLSVLVDLAYIAKVPVGTALRITLLDVVNRVKNLRPYAVQLCRRILNDTHFTEPDSVGDDCKEVIYAAAWICGEYSSADDAPQILRELLPNPEQAEDPRTIAVRLMAVAKVFGRWAANVSSDWTTETRQLCLSLIEDVFQSLKLALASPELVVEERASNLAHLFALIRNDIEKSAVPTTPIKDGPPVMPNGFVEPGSGEVPSYPRSLFLLSPLFDSYELNPVGYKAQERVSLPDGLDLDTPLVDPALLRLENDDGDVDSGDDHGFDAGGSESMAALQTVIRGGSEGARKKRDSKGKRLTANGEPETKEERAARRAAKREKQAGNPHYLPIEEDADDDLDNIPIVKLELDEMPEEIKSGSHRLLSRVNTPKPSGSSRDAEEPRPEYQIDRGGEMPDGSKADPSERVGKKTKRKTANHGLKQVDIVDESMLDEPTPAPSGRMTYDSYEPDDEEVPRGEQAILTTPVEVVQVVNKKKKKKKQVDFPGDNK